jgi:hypothetical protein
VADLFPFGEIMSFWKSLTLSSTVAVLFAGCASVPEVQGVDPAKTDQAIVFGKVVVIEDNKVQKLGMTLDGIDSFRLLVLPPEKSHASVYEIAPNGKFFWGLTPGEYTLLGCEYNKGTSVRGNRLWRTFTVPPDASSLYVGDLYLFMDKGRCLTGVKDDYENALVAYRAQFPQRQDLPGKGLIGSPEKLGSYTKVKQICAPEWGVECDRNSQGVKPISPQLSGTEPITVDGLAPRFAWEPSTDTDVAYDLVIFEAASYRRGSLTQYMPGRQVKYVEGLSSPSYAMEEELKPGTRYFWSVRLRRGDTISNWSTYGYFHFYLVAWATGGGHWFSFVTPGE